MYTLFISDLHLTDQRPRITELFIKFLNKINEKCEALYILGDLFESWLGDDCILPEYQSAIQALQRATQKSLPVFIQHGNRDFLLGEDFAQQTGARLLPEALIIDLHGTATLIMHGDTLCTDDIEYQKFRTMVRDPAWQLEVLQKTPQQRIELAKKFRETSKTEIAAKADDIMDVNQNTVESILQEENIQQLIHGHTHRPAIHDFTINNKNCKRIVLGDWYEQSSVLKCDASGCAFI